MKLDIKTLHALLLKPVVNIKHEEFLAAALLLDWKVIGHDRYGDVLRILIKHEETRVEVTFFPNYQGTFECACFIGNIGAPYKQNGDGNAITLMDLIQKFRAIYCREYSVTIQRQPMHGYTGEELESLGDFLVKAIFSIIYN